MGWQSTPHVAVLFVSAAICAIIVWYAVWQTYLHGRDRTVIAFSILLGGMAVYSFARGMQLGHTTRAEKLVWARFVYLGFAPGVAAWFVFSVEHNAAKHRLGRRELSVLVVYVILTAIAGLTNPYHELLWSTDPAETVLTGDTLVTLDRAFGPLFLVVVLVAYVFYVVGIFLLLRTAIGDKSLFRDQALAVGLGSVIPVATALPYIFGVSPGGVDFTPASFALSGIAYAYAIFRYRMLDVKPVARDTILSNMRDGFVVLDRQGQIVDYNAEATRFLETDQLLGKQLTDLLSVTEAESTGVDNQAKVFTTDDGLRVEVERTQINANSRQSGELVMFRDITERKQREQLRQQKNERLEKFAEIVSHDLRNPLSVASVRLELARQDPDGEHLDKIEGSLDRMETIIDDTLTLARQGQTVAKPKPVDLAALAERSWEGVETDGEVLVTEDTVWIEADSERLTQVFENLFRNSVEHGYTSNQPGADDAIEHGSTSRTVTVRVGTLPDGFFVEDDGSGIDPDIRDKLFNPGVTTDPDGTGFGLVIISDIIDAHGWEITATESAAGGARFEITGVEFVTPDSD